MIRVHARLALKVPGRRRLSSSVMSRRNVGLRARGETAPKGLAAPFLLIEKQALLQERAFALDPSDRVLSGSQRGLNTICE